MPILKNSRWEAFAQAVASGLSASEAYRKIGGKGKKNADVHSNRMMVNDGIKDRIAELKADSTTNKTLTRQEWCEVLAKIVRDEKERTSDRINAIITDAKLAGELNGQKAENTLIGNIARPIIFAPHPIIATPRFLPPRKTSELGGSSVGHQDSSKQAKLHE